MEIDYIPERCDLSSLQASPHSGLSLADSTTTAVSGIDTSIRLR